MSKFASMFTDGGIVLLEHVSAHAVDYRLVVHQRGERMMVVRTGGGREEVVFQSLDEDALEIVKWEHLLHEESLLAPGAEILLHHRLEEVVACLDGEVWPLNRAVARIERAAAVDWRGRYEAITDLWGDPGAEPAVGSPGGERHIARAALERRAAEQGVALSRMLTVGLVDRVVAGRLSVGRALKVARRATFGQLLGYEPI